jgi:hypothetical protein
METVLAGLQWDICLIYLDDVIVLGRSCEDMVANLRKVYDRLLAAGLKLKAKKCHLFCKKVVLLVLFPSISQMCGAPFNPNGMTRNS